jgi:hypothetical protein
VWYLLRREEVSTMTKIIFEKATAIVELPPPPPAHVVMWEDISADRYRCKDIGCWVAPPEEPPHNDKHAPEGPRDPRRINVSDNLNLTESLTVVLIKGSDAA